MTIHATLSDARFEIEHDDRLMTRVLVRSNAGVAFTPLTMLRDFEPLHAHVARISRLSDAALIKELLALKWSHRESDCSLWSLWRLTFLMNTSVLLDLELRGGEMSGRHSDTAGIRRALRHARGALGLGARNAGAPRRKRSESGGDSPAS